MTYELEVNVNVSRMGNSRESFIEVLKSIVQLQAPLASL